MIIIANYTIRVNKYQKKTGTIYNHARLLLFIPL